MDRVPGIEASGSARGRFIAGGAMPNGNDPVRVELGNIDYLLDQLARSVERGEVERAAYDALAPRYLARRADLVAALERQPVRPVGPSPSAQLAGTTPVPAPARVDSSAALPVRVPTAREPVRVNWTGVLTGVGALLVIIASAIFSVATWDIFSVAFKVGFLGLLTAGFYGAGLLVRSRLNLAAGGVALVAVGSAMLLLDGWIVIDGFDLAGAWPWVVWLTVCSAVYWYTEVRLAGRFFGAIGAAAQIAWVWLLGQGLGWTTAPRMAGIALVAVGWAVAGRAARDREPLATLALIMRWAAPAAGVAAVVGVSVDLALAPPGWTQLIAALVVGAAVTAIAQLTPGVPVGVAALAHVPAFAILASMAPSAAIEWDHVIVLAVMAVSYLFVELSLGGHGHALLALVAEAGAWLALSMRYDWAGDVTLAVVAAVALSWLLAARLLEDTRDASQRWRGQASTAQVAVVGGYVTLVLTSLLVPAVQQAVPLAGSTIVGRDAVLVLFVTLLWSVATLVRVQSGPGGLVIVGAFYSAAALEAWLLPGLHSAFYATVLVAVALALVVFREPIGRVLRLRPSGIAAVMRFVSLAVLGVGLAASAYSSDLRAWQTAVLLGAFSAFWCIDALFAEKNRAGLLIAASALVSAVGVSGWLVEVGGEGGRLGVAAAAAASGIGLSAVVLRGRRGWRDAWPLGAALTATLAGLTAIGHSGALAVTLALVALTWAFAAYVLSPELVFATGAAASLAALAALAWVDGPAWVTIAVMLVVAGVHLAPSLFSPGGLAPWFRRAAGALAISGVLATLLLIALRVPGLVGLGTGQWARVGEQGLVVALLGLGAYCAAAGQLHRFEPAVYAAGAALVLATWAQFAALDTSVVAPYSTVLALYLAWVGIRWARSSGSPPPLVIDALAALIAFVPPSIAAVTSGPIDVAWTHLVWAIGLSLAGLGLGVALKVRAYFFGGAVALVFVSVLRSWLYLAQYWWLVLGIIGVAMLVIALTWERQHQLLETAKHRVESTFDGWR